MVYTDDFDDVFAGDAHRLFRFDGQGFVQASDPHLCKTGLAEVEAKVLASAAQVSDNPFASVATD
jgi:hypothetical protein